MSQPRNDRGKGKQDQGPKNDINCIEFKYEQLQEATKKFCDSCKLGEGGFGPVYKGTLLYTTVAIKQLRKVSMRQCFYFKFNLFIVLGKW